MYLWAKFGPLGSRRLTARKYNQANGRPPEAWDWAASFLGIDVPDFLLRTPARACRSILATPKVGKAPSPLFDKTAVVVCLCVESSKSESLDLLASAPKTPPCSVGGGCGTSRSTVKASASNILGTSCPLQLRRPLPACETGAASPPLQSKRNRAQKDEGKQPLHILEDIGETPPPQRSELAWATIRATSPSSLVADIGVSPSHT